MSTMPRLTAARRLAQSQRPLADVLIGRLRRKAAGFATTPGACAGRPRQLALRLEDDGAAAARPREALPGPAPSRYAVAALLGQALDANRNGLARLQDADAVALIEVPSADMVEPVRALLERHVVGAVNVADPVALRSGGLDIVGPGMVAIFTDRDDGRPPNSEQTDDLVRAARAGCALVAISADAQQLLPDDFVRMASIRIVVPRVDGAVVRAVVKAVTAADPGPVGAVIARGLTLQAFDLAVRADLGTAVSLERLTLLAGGRRKDETPALALAEMHGLGEARTWALDLIADLKAYSRGDLAWGQIAACATIWSRPGCGKTALARALAREAGCAFIATSYAQWQAHREGHLGHVTQAIRKTFAEARKKAPCIVFVDEIDTLGTRGSSKRDEDWWRAIINALLEELDGFDRREGVAVIAACNNPERLDPALTRAGRLDRLIEIPLPDVPALAAIFRTYLGDELAGADLIDVALNAHGGSGADVECWVRDARAIARRAGRVLTEGDLAGAVRGDRQELPEPVRRRIAYHEAGHAVAIAASGVARPLSLSISDKGGLSHNEPGERRALTRAHLETYLMILLAGRAAEVLVYGDGTAGAGGSEDSDLGGATAMATRLETAYGLGMTGLLYLPVEPERQILLAPHVRDAVTKTLERMHGAAVELLARNRPLLDALAKALFDRGYLDAAAIGEVLDRHPLHCARRMSPPSVAEQPAISSPEPAAADLVQPTSRDLRA